MNSPTFIARKRPSAVFLSLLLATTLSGADKPTPRYQGLANELALSFLNAPAHADGDLQAFLEKEQATSPKLKAAVEQAVAAGRALIADGVGADSKYFARLLADSTETSPPAGNRTPPGATGQTQSPAATTNPTETEIAAATTDLWRTGIDRLKALTPGEQNRFAAFNSVNPDDLLRAFRQTAPPTASKTAEDAAPNASERKAPVTVVVPAAIQPVDSFLIAVGYEQKVAAAKVAGTVTPPAAVEASKKGFAAVRTPPALQTEAWLRNNGLSFGAGLGIAHYGGEDHPMASILARWNLWQRPATAKWNQRIGESNPEGYAQVPYWGAVEYYNRGDSDHERIPFKKRFSTSYLRNQITPVLPEVSFIGLFLGRAVAGEKITVRGKEERPYLFGASLGLGYYREAAPFVTFDIGKTISPNIGIKSASNYIGVSFDALVLASITGMLNKPATVPSSSGTPTTTQK